MVHDIPDCSQGRPCLTHLQHDTRHLAIKRRPLCTCQRHRAASPNDIRPVGMSAPMYMWVALVLAAVRGAGAGSGGTGRGGAGRGGAGRGGAGRGGAHEATWHSGNSANKQGWWWGLSLSLTASHRLHVEKHAVASHRPRATRSRDSASCARRGCTSHVCTCARTMAGHNVLFHVQTITLRPRRPGLRQLGGGRQQLAQRRLGQFVSYLWGVVDLGA